MDSLLTDHLILAIGRSSSKIKIIGHRSEGKQQLSNCSDARPWLKSRLEVELKITNS